MSTGPSNTPTKTGTWSDATQRAPGHADIEFVGATDAFLDPSADAAGPAIRSAKSGGAVTLPYPEATYWARYGSKIFNAVTTVVTFTFDQTTWRFDQTAVTFDKA